MDISEIIKSKLESIKELRRTLHENAEIAHKEFKTQKIIMDTLDKLEIKNYKCAETGVVGILNEEEDCVAVRADIDALPVNGVSHVCGHDYHMTVALGTAMVLKEIGYKKGVKFIFQPAEEADGGALPMIKEGVLENPKVKAVIGYHVWPELPVGCVQAQGGPSMGSVDDFHIKIKGVGGHAAMPQHCKNPIMPAVDIIQSINFKSRNEIDPLNSHIITFAALSGGTASNVITDEVIIKGTVRTFDNDLRYKLADMIEKTSKLCAEKYDCSAEVDYLFEYPPLICHEELSERFAKASKRILGEENVLPVEKTFAGEDFAFFAQEVPSVHFRLGIANGEKGIHPLHSPNFTADENALYYGIYSVVNFIVSEM